MGNFNEYEKGLAQTVELACSSQFSVSGLKSKLQENNYPRLKRRVAIHTLESAAGDFDFVPH